MFAQMSHVRRRLCPQIVAEFFTPSLQCYHAIFRDHIFKPKPPIW